MVNSVLHGDCLELMKDIPNKSIDMILCDLPYGTTACKWDVIIPFDLLWLQYERIIKDNGAIVLTASQPFTTLLISSNLKLFRYEWIWEKTLSNDRFNAKLKPMKFHENILVFSKGVCANGGIINMNYNPQGLKEVNKIHKRPKLYKTEHNMVRKNHKLEFVIKYENYPRTILKFNNGNNKNLHPTQKPVEYLIKTYTNENDLVLDNCAGSGTTAIAALNTNRNYILMEKEEKYFNIINERIKNNPITEFNT